MEGLRPSQETHRYYVSNPIWIKAKRLTQPDLFGAPEDKDICENRMDGLGGHHRAEFEKELDRLEVLLEHIRRSATSLRARLDNPPESPAPAPPVETLGGS